MNLKKLFFILTLHCLFFHLQAREYNMPEESKKIFILNSYHQTMEWSVDVEEGYNSLIENAKCELYIEYIDSRRVNYQEERERLLTDIFNTLYRDIEFDLIVLIDDPALFFFNNYYKDIVFAKNVPLVAAGINTRDPRDFENLQDITIVYESVYAKENILQIKEFFPDTKNIYVLLDHSLSGHLFRIDIEKQIANLGNEVKDINFYFNEDLSFAEIVQEISSLPPQSVLLAGTYHIDGNRVYYPKNEILSSIKEVKDIPIFSLLDIWMAPEILGGYMNSGNIQGYLVGKEMMDKLGISHGDIGSKELNEIQGMWAFSYPELVRYKLLDRKLPDDSTILYTEDPLSRKHRKLWYIFLISSIILLIVLIIIFAFNKVLKKRVRSSVNDLQHEIDKFEFFVSEMPIGYVEMDYMGKVVDWNKAAENIFGYPKNEILGKDMVRLLQIEDDAKTERLDIHEFEANDTVYRFACATTKDNRKIQCDWYLTHYCKEGTSPRIFVMVIDITEKEELRQNLEKMLTKTKEVMLQNDRYMASTMHDLKNLVLPIVAYSEVLLVENISQERIKSFTEYLNKSATSLVDIFNEMLDFSKIRNKLMNVEPEHFNIRNKIEDLLIIMEGSFTQKNIEVRNEVEKSRELYADSEMITSVLLNLLSNAVKFTHHGGLIIISGRKLEGDLFEIRVKDNGVGIKDQDMENLFSSDKYFTTKGTDGEVGTGLGLVLAKELIEKNNGTIHVENNPEGQGTTFSFILPTHPDHDDMTHDNESMDL